MKRAAQPRESENMAPGEKCTSGVKGRKKKKKTSRDLEIRPNVNTIRVMEKKKKKKKKGHKT